MSKRTNLVSICDYCKAHDICDDPTKGDKPACADDIYTEQNLKILESLMPRTENMPLNEKGGGLE